MLRRLPGRAGRVQQGGGARPSARGIPAHGDLSKLASWRACVLAQLAGPGRQFAERGDHLGDHAVATRDEVLTELADAAQARRQPDLYPVRRGEVDRVLGMEPEPYLLAPDTIAREAFGEEGRASRAIRGSGHRG